MRDKKPTPAERFAYMSLETVINSIEPAITALGKRLGGGEEELVQAAACAGQLRQMLERAEENMPPATRDYIIQNSRKYEVVIRERRVVKDPNWMYVKTDDLELVCREAIAGRCFMCIATGKEASRCNLRRVLQFIIDEPARAYGCGYADYAHGKQPEEENDL